MGVGIFSDCIFFLKVNSLPLKQRKKLKSSITSNGGEISFVLNDKCTHVVVSNPATLNSTQQKKIVQHVISVVNPDFIWKSVQEKRVIESEYQDNDKPFEVIGDQDQEEKKNLFLDTFLAVQKKKTLERNLEEDLQFEDGEYLDNVENIPDDTEVAKYSCFQKDEEYAIVELLCFNRQEDLPFRVSTVHDLPNTSQKEFAFHQVDTPRKACEKYEFRVNDVKNKGFTQINRIPLQAEKLASKALKKVLLGEADITELSPEVAGLVEIIWVDAVGHLDAILSCPVENFSLNDVSKAEGILCQLRNALIKKDKKEDIHQMVQEFYQCIPHKDKIQSDINMKFLTVKQDLCQVIRDMVNVCETNVSGYTSTSNAKYQALRCRIDHIDPNSAEFHQVKQGILNNNHSNREFNILRVFRVGRLSEANNFKSDLGNVTSLLHASSPCNFVGILSRGLMLPKIIVEEFGGERTDIGNLGSGIYFSDAISTSIKYSQPSDVTGSRLLMVCDVALGKCNDVCHKDYTPTEPPNGFNSVHGVQRKEGFNSDFTDDEYVVYNVNQVQMTYIVQFSTDGDVVDLHKESLFILFDQTPDNSKRLPEPTEEGVSLDDLPDSQVTKAGLKGSDGQQIPLESIHVKARLMDLIVKVVMFQTYKNNSTFPIEAKYVFPLDSTAAVCGFEAFINGKHIIGEVKEKQQAHREYRTAISEGHGAYLMDQDAPDVFTVSVGNLPSKATVVIKITYVMELNYEYGYTRFCIPGNLAQWQQDKALKENTQDTITKVGVESDMAAEGPFCLDMSIEMPRKIENIECYTHTLKIKKTECKAVIQTEESSSFNANGISVDIYVEDAYIPRMWVEKHPDEDSEACMLVFKPNFENLDYDYGEDVFVTICLDCSNSMESCFHSAKLVALLTFHFLYSNCVNIVLFGSNYKEFYIYPKPRPCDISDMEQFIKEAKPTMGSTEFWKVLQSLCLLRPKRGSQKVVLISDGHIQNENLVFQILAKNHIQLFTCGVGTTTNKHMLKCIAQYSSGAFEYFADNSKSKWKDQMTEQSKRLNSPACTAVSVKWRQFNQKSSEILQAPRNIEAVFSNDSILVYGFVPHCTQATLKALIANKEFENMVSTTELQKTTGTILHTLTARALIKDYEYGTLHEKENENEMKKQEMKSLIIQLSIEYSLVTPFTSFVAVEKRTAEESIDIEPDVHEIISSEDVDILPYMNWSSHDDSEESDRSLTSESKSSSETETTSEMDQELERSDGFLSTCFLEDLFFEPELLPDMGYSEVEHQCLQSVEPISTTCSLVIDHPPMPMAVSGMALFGSAQFSDSSSLAGFSSASEQRKEKSSDALKVQPFSLNLGFLGSHQERLDSLLSSEISMPRAPILDKYVTISSSAQYGEDRSSSPDDSFGFGLAEEATALFKPVESAQLSSWEPAVEMSAPVRNQCASKTLELPKQPLSTPEIHLHNQWSRERSKTEQVSHNFLKRQSMEPSSAPSSLVNDRPPMPVAAPGMALFGSAPTFGFPSLGGFHFAQKEMEALSEPTFRLSSLQEDGSSSSLFGSAGGHIHAPVPNAMKDFEDSDYSSRTSKRKSLRKSRHRTMKPASFSPPHLTKQLMPPSWPSLSSLQNQEGYWLLNVELGTLLKINVRYLTEDFLVKKGITSLGAKGIDAIHKLIATLLVLQIVRTYNLLSGIKFKTLMKLDQYITKSFLSPNIEKAIHWAIKSDQQYPGICIRLGLGKDWDQVTRQLLGLDPISKTSDLYSVSQCLLLP